MRRQVKFYGLLAAVPGCAALTLAATPASAEFRLQPSLSVQETFSDNVDQDPNGQETAAFTTDVTPSVTLRGTGARVTTTLDLSMTASHQTDGNDEGLRAEPEVSGVVSAEILERHLFLDASAAASSELLDTRVRNTSDNRSIVQTYSASPRLVGRFGNFADPEVSYRFDQIIDDGSGSGTGLGNSQTHTVEAKLNSGTDFANLRWGLRGQVSENRRGSASDVSRTDTALDLEYAVDRSFSVLGSAGYQKFDDGNGANDIEGLTWNAGIRWRPGQRTNITATYGKRDDQESIAADASYQLTPRIRAFATYDETLETGQERLSQDLSSIGTDPNTGALIDTRTGLPFNASTSTTTLDNGTQRRKTLTSGLTGISGRNTFGIQGTAEFTEDEGGMANEEDAYGVDVNWERQLSTRSQLEATASYTRNEFSTTGREDDEYSFNLQYGYSIYTNIRAFGGYGFRFQDSNNIGEEFLENSVSLGVGVTF